MRGTTSDAAKNPPRIAVLIVDDDSFLAETFQLILEDAGFYVETASTGAEALAKAAITPFKLAITDLKLPDATGSELSKELKEIIPGLSVVLLTGMSNVEKSGNSLDGVLQKPIDPLELLRVSTSLSANM
jgi:DNA-binding response OmpR family regulator